MTVDSKEFTKQCEPIVELSCQNYKLNGYYKAVYLKFFTPHEMWTYILVQN